MGGYALASPVGGCRLLGGRSPPAEARVWFRFSREEAAARCDRPPPAVNTPRSGPPVGRGRGEVA